MARRGRRLGWMMVALIALLAVGVAAAIRVQRDRALRYTLVFGDAQGLRAGDRVQLMGADIGQVRKVTLRDHPAQIDVEISVAPEQAAMIHSDSTGVIHAPDTADAPTPRVVEILNPEPAPGAAPQPMASGQTVRGLNSVGDLLLWKARQALSAHGEAWAQRLDQLGATLDAAREEIQSLASSPEVQKSVEDLKQFMAQMQEQGRAALAPLQARWQQLQIELAPVIEKLRTLNRQNLVQLLQQLEDQINQTFQSWQSDTPTPTPTLAPPPLTYPTKPYTSRTPA